jgi:Cytochrome c7 and related cytochrome c
MKFLNCVESKHDNHVRIRFRMKDLCRAFGATIISFRYAAAVILLLLVFSVGAHAQISPGPLSSAHANLEGITNCTSCHTFGRQISNVKCLLCHKEIDTRIKANEGYHATVSSQECAKCHQEHLGRTYEIVNFDTSTFNHSVVGFVLDGKHETIGCRDCHNPTHIVAPDVKKLPSAQLANTYLGLSPTCLSCHEDVHKGQFSQTCSSCHNTRQWKPASNFDHDKTPYPLTGEHRTVACYSCHTQKMSDAKTINYTGLVFSSCASCHADPHKGAFKEACSTCHTTETFFRVTGGSFDHSKTKFPLLGKHAEVKCVQCHQEDPKKLNVSGGLGFHISRFKECSDCHADAHAGQFDKVAGGDKCERCHNVEGFTPATYTITDHQKTPFPLEGAHLAVACTDCHTAHKVNAPSTRQFIWAEKVTCTTCHSNVHGDQFAKIMAAGCVTCHTSDSWQKLLFSHDKTDFPLTGKHAAIACSACHKRPANSKEPVQYVGVETHCYSCHEDAHAGQFAFDGTTHCSTCHTSESWKKLIFDHDTQSDFPLTGKHIGLPCEKCHPTVEIDDKPVVKYRPIGTRCIDCHST